MDPELIRVAIYAFSVIISLAILGFTVMMVIAFWAAKPDEPMAFTRLVADGNGLRIVTVIAIVLGIVYLGFTGILEDTAISPILSGIAGYVLGGWTMSRVKTEDEPANPP